MGIDFSIIIPQRNSIGTLKRLFDSIPTSERIEILLVDNSPTPITKEEIGVERDYKLLWSSPERFAGGARNVGLENATGKWLLFADADDYFEADAFDTFYSFFNNKADIIYFCANSVYSDSGKEANRGDIYSNAVHRFLFDDKDEYKLRFGFNVPWAKMVRSELVKKNHIYFDEVIAANDAFFSVLTGFYASSIIASENKVYVVTVSKGSLTNRRDGAVVLSRFEVALRINSFLKSHGFSNYQQSVLNFLRQSIHYGSRFLFKTMSLLLKYKQNPIVGWQNWGKTLMTFSKDRSDKSKYITY